MVMNDFAEYVEARPECITPILKRWKAEHPELGVLVLVPEAEQEQVIGIQGIFREYGVPLMGAIFPALVTNQDFVTQGVWLIGYNPMPPWFLLDELNTGSIPAHVLLSDASQNLHNARPHASADLGTATLFLIFDAMVPNIGSIMLGVHQILQNKIQFSGVNAGSETFKPMPCLFDQDRLVEHGVLGFLLPETTVSLEHSYPVASTLMKATSTKGNRINSINHRSAMIEYQEVIFASYGVKLTHENFYDYAVHYPFGVVTAADVVVRIPVGFDDDGSIICAGEVPPDSFLRLIRAPTLDESHCIDTIVTHLLAQPKVGRNALLTFYCAGRRMHFGESASEELAQLRNESGVEKLMGALSLGEIGTFKESGIPAFHNAALVCF
jgi:hypothetical protein